MDDEYTPEPAPAAPQVDSVAMRAIAKWWREADCVLVAAGAGMSAESG
jgi:hypothetical protein